ncbi:Glutamate receptor ionotropic, NMDA 3A [Frankliniella fusca]|uniref:Glutamate receptor ionotropic, NMDA 3A n=1 Tax=Frankliniella fusca TaxID=407009 RepID=A0AAE1LKD3_9NEOP|nr:Glutamate receptor ionotropic, NMDA 3A [Frankliniella fusca]
MSATVQRPGPEKAESKVKFALMLGEAGDDALEVYNSFKDRLVTTKKDAEGKDVVEDMSQDFESVVKEFESYAAEKKCLLACREMFRQRNQKPKESVATWLAALRNLSRDCEFSTIEDSLIQNRLILGTYDKNLRDTLLRKSNLPLQEVVDIHRLAETGTRFPRASGSVEEAVSVDAVHVQPFNRKGGKAGKGNYNGKGKNRKSKPESNKCPKPSTSSGRRKAFTYNCRKCLEVHEAGNCPAWGKKCHRCGVLNHYAATHKEKSVRVEEKKEPTKKVNTLVTLTRKEEESLLDGKFSSSEEMDMQESEVRYVESLTTVGVRPKEYLEEIRINDTHWVVFKLDPGSQANLLPKHVFQLINSQTAVDLKPTKTVLEAWDKSTRRPEGTVRLKVETKYGRSMVCKFYIVPKDCKAILNIWACEDLNLVKRVNNTVTHVDSVNMITLVLPDNKEEFLGQFKELFTGLGQFKQKVTIVVDPNVQPRMCPPRRYNFSIINRLKDKLDNLEQRGVVAKITTESPKFVSNLVIREKNDGDLRICLDPQVLNTAIVRQTYAIPTQEELAYKVRDKAVNYIDDTVEDDPEMLEYVHEVVKNIPMSSDMKETFLKETDKDAGLSLVKQFYQEGWPVTRDKLDGKILRRNTYHLKHSITKPDQNDSGVNMYADDFLDSLRADQNRVSATVANALPNPNCVLTLPAGKEQPLAELSNSGDRGQEPGTSHQRFGTSRSGRRLKQTNIYGVNDQFF